jgi:hypothetical protein
MVKPFNPFVRTSKMKDDHLHGMEIEPERLVPRRVMPTQEDIDKKLKETLDRMQEEKNKRDKEGTRFDQGKNRLDIIPPEWIWALADVLTQGAVKYDVHNWEKGMNWSRILGSGLRHVVYYIAGQKYDKETGCHHLAMAAWNFLALMSYELREIGENDLFKYDPSLLNKVHNRKS